jgi:gluconate 2-dehydrogenase
MAMKPKVFVARPVPPEVEAFIAEHCDYGKWERNDPIPRAELLSRIGDVEGLYITGGKIDDELLDHAPALKIVSNASVGYNNFDIEAMKNRKVIGTNTPYVLDDTVADLIIGLMISAARRIPELDRYVKEGKWKKSDVENLFGLDVHHKTLGIIGLGRIGEAVAKRAKCGFDMDVLYHNRRRNAEAEEKWGAVYCTKEELLRKSDFVLLMTPLTAETRHLMGKKEFSLMRESAIFINASRGETVDEQALLEALKTGQIRAAALDVYAQEPVDKNHPLLALPQVVTVPHIGSATAQTRLAMAMLAAENLVDGVLGRRPKHIVKELADIF